MNARIAKAALLAGSLVLPFSAITACGSDFRPKNAVEGVRILAARADLPYARPGEMVNVQVLAHDGRLGAKREPMRLFWFPALCVDKLGASHYGCYPILEALFPTGVDLTSSLLEGSGPHPFAVPADALDGVDVRPGQRERYVTAYAFVAACAGHLERVPRRSGLGPNQLPVGCFDSAGRELGAEDFVFGYTRVFIFAERRNAIPSLDGVTFEGKPVDLAAGIGVNRCTKADDADCTAAKLDVVFSDAAAEVDPDNVDEDGKVGRETIYVDWFTTVGKFATDRKILFDGHRGRPPKTTIDFTPPNAPAKGTMWAVLHDNRGGTSWMEFPIEIR